MNGIFLRTALFILAFASSPAFSENYEKPAKCNHQDDLSFVKEISSDRKNLEKYMPENVFFGTLYARSGSVYETQYSPKDFSIPFIYFSKNTENKDVWVNKDTIDNEYPEFFKVDISRNDKDLLVRWQNAEFDIGKGGKPGKFRGTKGEIQQMEFTPEGKNGCWELRAVYSVEEKL